MERRCCQLVLLLLLLMAVMSPFLQLDSWDKFPISSDDIECQVTYWLCSIGMLLTFAILLKLVQVLRRVIRPALFFCAVENRFREFDILFEPDLPPPPLIPLRI
jgi:TRAP-type C4-dicarboxylate transport system permease small subunit